MFWEKYKLLCYEKGLSPNAVAKELSISSGTVTRWKKGSEPQATTIGKIAEFFNVTTDYLLSDEEKKPVHVDEPTGTSLSPEEKLLLTCYKKMTDADRNILYALLNKYETETENEIINSNINYAENNEMTTIYDVPIYLQRKEDKIIDGIQYYKYAVSIKTKINGVEIPIISYCKINNETCSLALVANSIFGESNNVPAQIVKKINYITVNKKIYLSTNYNLQIKSLDSNGTQIICPFTSIDEGNRVMFQNIIEFFKNKGLLD